MRAWVMDCSVCFKICASGANLMTTQNISDSEIPPAKAREERQVRITIFFAAFASLREIFRIFGCGFCRAVSLSRPLAFLVEFLDKTFPHEPVDD